MICHFFFSIASFSVYITKFTWCKNPSKFTYRTKIHFAKFIALHCSPCKRDEIIWVIATYFLCWDDVILKSLLSCSKGNTALPALCNPKLLTTSERGFRILYRKWNTWPLRLSEEEWRIYFRNNHGVIQFYSVVLLSLRKIVLFFFFLKWSCNMSEIKSRNHSEKN